VSADIFSCQDVPVTTKEITTKKTSISVEQITAVRVVARFWSALIFTLVCMVIAGGASAAGHATIASIAFLLAVFSLAVGLLRRDVIIDTKIVDDIVLADGFWFEARRLADAVSSVMVRASEPVDTAPVPTTPVHEMSGGSTTICPACGARTPEARFCQRCGAEIFHMKCSRCKFLLDAGQKFCAQCGLATNS
jgi:hypothetical protein